MFYISNEISERKCLTLMWVCIYLYKCINEMNSLCIKINGMALEFLLRDIF